MTVDEFLGWPGDGTSTKYQLVDGEIHAMAPASARHGRIQARISRLLGAHLDDGPCQLLVAPGVVPRARSDTNLRIPDLGVTCEPDELVQQTLLDPILLIEILSPSNERETRRNVWAYVSIPTVREVLLVESIRVAAELLRRQPDGFWPPDPQILGPDDQVSLTSIDFTCALKDFYRGTRLAESRAS
jgi:Uma2 family endonuclease